MGYGIATFDKKRFSFPKIWSRNLCHRCKGGEGAKIGSKGGIAWCDLGGWRKTKDNCMNQ